MLRLIAVLPILCLLVSCTSPDEHSPRIFFEAPEDGAEVVSPVEIRMGASGISIVRAGVFDEDSGHFHLLINTEATPAGEIVPADSSHLHFGDGSSTTSLALPPGEHVLILQLGDGAHAAIEGMQDEVRITVR